MKKILLVIFGVMILIVSIVLIVHISTNESVMDYQSDEEINIVSEISTEVDTLLLEENDDIDIGEMI